MITRHVAGGLAALGLFSLGVACGDGDEPVAVTTPPSPVPSVRVTDQTLDPADAVLVSEVVSAGPGWIVIHEDDGGAPGAVIGFSAVADGANPDVSVALDRAAEDQEVLYAMLHADAGVAGTYEFPGPDGPVMNAAGQVITPAFTVTIDGSTAIVPSVTVADQLPEPADNVVVAEAVSDGPGWIVIHEDNGGAPGSVIGQTGLASGPNANVSVTLSRDVVAGETLFAMLHLDAGEVGTYEFPGPDGPVTDADGMVITPSFVVQAPTPSVTVVDQTLTLSTVVSVDAAVSVGPGWVVIHEDAGGAPGPVLGFAGVSSGPNPGFSVPLTRGLQDGETVFAMLHVDDGVLGAYEFPGADGPVIDSGMPVAPPLTVTVPEGTPAVRLRFSGSVPSYTVAIEPSTFADDLIGGSEDPTLRLRSVRYEVVNAVFGPHPLEIIDAAETVLLSQSDAGTLEADAVIRWTDDGAGTSRFTVDGDLAASATEYRCSVHPGSMRGTLQF